jgi:hypothetical protein
VVPEVQGGVAVAGPAVNDIVHLLAEIIENATFYSAGENLVRVSGRALDSGGILIEVTDNGVGIPAERLAQLNARLDDPPMADVSVSRHMGLFAVSHLAARHGVRVRLQQAAPRGLTALVWIPQTLITADSGGAWQGTPGAGVGPRAAGAAGAGWSAFGRHRSLRKAIATQPSNMRVEPVVVPDPPIVVPPAPAAPPAEPDPAAPPAPGAPGQAAEPVPIYESMASEWFRRGGQAPLVGAPQRGPAGAQLGWDSPADAGWRAAESAVTPVRGQLTAAGLPRRIPRANMVPGSVDSSGKAASGKAAAGQAQAGQAAAAPAGQAGRRSADVTRSRLAGFQRGTRRAEAAAGKPAGISER